MTDKYTSHKDISSLNLPLPVHCTTNAINTKSRKVCILILLCKFDLCTTMQHCLDIYTTAIKFPQLFLDTVVDKYEMTQYNSRFLLP